MNLNYQEHIPAGFADDAKVWIYQSSRKFLISEALEMEQQLEQFVNGWMSHGAPVKGYANLLFGQFLILMADETATTVGGCSTDTLFRLVQSLEEKFSVKLLDRLSLAFVVKESIQLLPLGQLEYAVENNFINSDTLYFNNTVLTKKALMENWIIPVKQSWLANKVMVNS